MKVTIDSKSGFCFGVVYAIEMAENILVNDKKLYCLGDIVHNNREVDRLNNLGLEIIDHKRLKSLKDCKVLIRAHGEPPSTYEIALDLKQATYPKEPYISFLDHILVSDSFIPKESNYHVQTIHMGDYMGGYEIYESYFSDHKPVLLSFSVTK